MQAQKKGTAPPFPNYTLDGTIFYLKWTILQRHKKYEGVLDLEKIPATKTSAEMWHFSFAKVLHGPLWTVVPDTKSCRWLIPQGWSRSQVLFVFGNLRMLFSALPSWSLKWSKPLFPGVNFYTRGPSWILFFFWEVSVTYIIALMYY